MLHPAGRLGAERPEHPAGLRLELLRLRRRLRLGRAERLLHLLRREHRKASPDALRERHHVTRCGAVSSLPLARVGVGMYSPGMDGAPTSSLAGIPPASVQPGPALPAALSVVPPPEPVAPIQSLSDSRWFINRELSWLAFNERVLEEACDPQVPALERLKFLAITSSNLDEFFMIRVAGLKSQLVGHVEESGPDALSPGEQLQAISVRAHEVVARQYRALLADVLLNLALRFGPAASGTRLRYGVVPVPSVLPRLVEVPDHGRCFVLLEDVIARHVAQLFPGMAIDGCWPFRVTRNWDLSIDEEEAEDLLVTIEREVRRRDRGSAVRLEIAAGAEQQMVDYLVRALKLGAPDVYRPEGPLNIPDLLPLLGRLEQKELHDEPFTPVVPPQLGDAERDLFRLIRERDVLLHHPYE